MEGLGASGNERLGEGWGCQAPSLVRARLDLKVMAHGAPTPSSQDLLALRGHSKSVCVKIRLAVQL